MPRGVPGSGPYAGRAKRKTNGEGATATLTRPQPEPTELGPAVSNDAAADILMGVPFQVRFTIQGTTNLLFHRWSVESIEEKAAAKKGSAQKKTDDVESYVWRNPAGQLCLPSEYVRQAIITAAKSRQDPRSPRKSARDLYAAGIASLDELGQILVNGKPVKNWDMLDRRRVRVQQAGITRSRPAMFAGWESTFEFQVLTPEYISFEDLLGMLNAAGRFVGVGDFRPTYGRFAVTSFKAISL